MAWFKKLSGGPKTIKIAAHGIAEEHLFIDTMQCPACGNGPIRRDTHCFPCTWIVKCECCGEKYEILSEKSLIMTEEYLEVLQSEDLARIRRYQRHFNHTAEPSHIIELTRWLQLITYWLSQLDELARAGEQASGDYVSAEFQLAQCLMEALKFYSEDDEFPPRDAFFSEEAYAQYQADTSVFSRQVLRSILAQQRPLEEIQDDLDRFEELPGEAT